MTPCAWDKHDWVAVGDCDHREEWGVLATAVRCRACGAVGHRVRIEVARRRRGRRPLTRRRAIARERAACPIWDELEAQSKRERAGERYAPAGARG